MYLFSYGSNHLSQLADRLGHSIEGVGAYAVGWQRVFRGYSQRWRGGVASLQKKEGKTTFGYVTRVTPADLAMLDRYEGVATGHYKRQKISVHRVDGDIVTAVAYIALSKEHNPPSKAYLLACATTVGTFWGGVKPSDFPIR